MIKKTINDIEVKDKVCLVRVDYNVPISDEGVIIDDLRIKESFNTIHNLISRGAKIVLISHLWRPQWEIKQHLKLGKIAEHLENILNIKEIPVCDFNNAEHTHDTIQRMKSWEIIFLENIRFHPNEKGNPKSFWRYLAQFWDIFVNEAFSVSHREHWSVTEIAKHLPAVAWIHLQSEHKYMKGFACTKKSTPYVVIIGGKKSKDKIPVMIKLIDKADAILITGWIANTFLKARWYEIGNSFYEPKMIEIAKEICYKAMQTNTALLLPEDVVITNNFEEQNKNIKVVNSNKIPIGYMTADIWPKTIKKYSNIIKNAWSILWTGPAGIYRYPEFRKWNNAIMEAISQNTAICLAGGGDTIASIKDHKKKHHISHISTGWGATLHYIQKGKLPGIEILHTKN